MDVSELAVQLESTDLDSKLNAAEQLSYLADGARSAAVPLVRASGDSSEEVREWVNSALEELGTPDPTDSAALAQLLTDASSDVGYWAATLLGRLEEDAAGQAPQLAAVVNSESPLNVRERAAWALGKIGPPAAGAKEQLAKAAAGAEPRLARLAGQALESIQG